MLAANSFDYAIVKVVPLVDRGECINVGAILFCRTLRFLEARVELDVNRLLALAPSVDLEVVRRHLDAIVSVAHGDHSAGPIAHLPMAGRFHWLVSPRSTIIQLSAVHSGLCSDPATTLDRLMNSMVRLPASQDVGFQG